MVSPLNMIKMISPFTNTPRRRQQRKEDKWRLKLEKDKENEEQKKGPSWWEKVNSTILERPSLLTLLRGKKHAEDDLKDVMKWRDDAINRFLEIPTPQPLVSVSPDTHFVRKYGPRKPLPKLTLDTRNRLEDEAKISKTREERTIRMRMQVFCQSRTGPTIHIR